MQRGTGLLRAELRLALDVAEFQPTGRVLAEDLSTLDAAVAAAGDVDLVSNRHDKVGVAGQPPAHVAELLWHVPLARELAQIDIASAGLELQLGNVLAEVERAGRLNTPAGGAAAEVGQRDQTVINDDAAGRVGGVQADRGDIDGRSVRAEIDVVTHSLLFAPNMESNRGSGGAVGLDVLPDRRGDERDRLELLLRYMGLRRPQSQRGPSLARPQATVHLPVAPVGIVNGPAHRLAARVLLDVEVGAGEDQRARRLALRPLLVEGDLGVLKSDRGGFLRGLLLQLGQLRQ